LNKTATLLLGPPDGFQRIQSSSSTQSTARATAFFHFL
jgi:hypothetical protein